MRNYLRLKMLLGMGLGIFSMPLCGQIFNDNCQGSLLPEMEMGFPNNFNPNDLTIERIELPYPILIYPADTHEVYVIGGQPFSLDLFVDMILTGSSGTPNLNYYNQFNPYVVKIHPPSLDTMFLELQGGTGIPYVGGVVAHPNGYVYAIARARLFKINPAGMTVEAFIDLPLLSPFSVYNGINVASNGNLITKSFILNDYSYGNFLMIDPDNLQSIFQLNAQVGTARTNFACDSLGNEFIYHINQDFTFRVNIHQDSLSIDSTWMARYQPFGPNYTTEPTSPRMLKNHVIYTTNTTPNATRPMKLFWQDRNAAYHLQTDTLDTYFMFSDTVSTGLSFFGLTTNEESGIFIGMDQLNGTIAAYTINSSNQLVYLWEKSYGITSIPAIEGNTGLVYANDFDAIQGVDYLVVLDVYTGAELGRIATEGTVPSISNLVPGGYGDVYYCSNETGKSLGYFHRITANKSSGTPNYSLKDVPGFKGYPNPFSESTTLAFDVPASTPVTIDLYDALGQHVQQVLEGNFESGLHKIAFDGSGLQNGLYYCQIRSKYDSKTIRITVSR